MCARGPTSGGMANPYLSAGEQGLEGPPNPLGSPALVEVTRKTWAFRGFQNQAMQIGRGRRGLTRQKRQSFCRRRLPLPAHGHNQNPRDVSSRDDCANGLQSDIAECMFCSSRGLLPNYGFPETMRRAFAIGSPTCSSWLKCTIPAILHVRFLNGHSQMGFTPRQIVRGRPRARD